MKVAIIGWGSLIWDKGSGANQLKTSSEFIADGPIFNIEFCRISKDGRVTLVIDSACGVPTSTYWTISEHRELGDAIENLRLREGTSNNYIHYVDSKGNHNFHDNDSLVSAKNWLLTHVDLDAMIWTGLVSNWSAKTGASFTLESLRSYLTSNIGTACWPDIRRYFVNAPSSVQTPARAVFEGEFLQY
jgi:hypothetical protein